MRTEAIKNLSLEECQARVEMLESKLKKLGYDLNADQIREGEKLNLIKEIIDSYDVRLFNAAKCLMKMRDVKDYLDLLDMSFSTLTASQFFDELHLDQRQSYTGSYQTMMDFVRELLIIDELQRAERRFRGCPGNSESKN